MIDLSGVTVATVLPFRDDFSIDWHSYDRLVAFCTAPKNIRAVFVNGHAGEGATLSPEERTQVIQHTRRLIGEDVPLVSGIIAYGTADAIRQAQEAEQAGADAIVLFPFPQYAGGASADGRYVIDFVDSMLVSQGLPISLFQQSVAAGVGFTTPVLRELAQRPRLVAIKEGSGDLALYEDNVRMVRAHAPHVQILASNYHWLLAQLATGADGILSGLASLVPGLLSDMWQARDDMPALRALNDTIYPVVRTIYGAPPLIDMHTRIKAALHQLGIIACAVPRAPLLQVSPEITGRVTAAAQASGEAFPRHPKS